jgi:glucosamine kinase
VSESKQYVLGVDGGGSKTNAVIVGMDGNVLAEAQGGPTNLMTVGVKGAVPIIFDLVKSCAEKINAEATSLSSIVIGIAGAGRAVERTEFLNALLLHGQKKKFPLKQVRIETDARIALEAAFAGGPGIVVVAGTGSIALYRTEDNKILRAGGWGKLVGDEGSGYVIGRDALNAVMRQADGRGEKTVLTQKAFEHFGVKAAEDIVAKIVYDRLDIASFAPKVFEAVVERDRTAHLLIVKNANDLADHVRVLVMKSSPKKMLAVALMGGILEAENVYSKLVKEKINHSLPQVVVQRPKFPAAFGAAIMALNAFR